MKLPIAISLALVACVGSTGDDSGRPDDHALEGEAALEGASPGSSELGVSGQNLPPLAERYDFQRRAARYDLPGRLDEVSGLAFTTDGRLFAHDDERARVHEIDAATGVVGKRFDLGQEVVRDDFEGIAVVDDRFFLVSSLGRLYEFREGSDRDELAFRVTDAGVGSDCEVEGLEYDPGDEALLLACKVATRSPLEIVVHRLALDPDRGPLPPLRVQKRDLTAHGLEPDFDPSAVAITPDDTVLLLSGRHDALLEVDRAGAVLSAVQLSEGRHPQSEGLAIGPDGTIYISDEKGGGKDARLTAYALRKPADS